MNKSTLLGSLAAVLLSSAVSLSAHATAIAEPICPTSRSNDFGVQYQLSGVQQGSLQLLRQGALTAYYNLANGVAEWWNFSNQTHPSFQRVFAKQQRRIDYYSGDLRTLNIHVSQTEIESFAAEYLRAKLPHQGAGSCANSQVYEGDYQHTHYHLVWSDTLSLPLSLTTVRDGKQQQWLATRLLSASDVTQRFATWQRYADTDYADIGDNETDPFLAQMINQGFIEHSEHAAYNSKGQPLSGQHIH